MKVLTRVLCAGVMVSVLAGCASNGTYVPSLPPHAKTMYMDYQSKPENKVFVVAIDPNGDFAVGYDYGRATKKEAYETALAQCKANAQEYGVLSKPNVYDINGAVVYEKAITQSQAK